MFDSLKKWLCDPLDVQAAIEEEVAKIDKKRERIILKLENLAKRQLRKKSRKGELKITRKNTLK